MKHKYSAAKNIADQIVASLAPYCQRIEVAGSVRRRRKLVGDIEIVAIPDVVSQPDLLGGTAVFGNRLHDHLDKLVKQQKIARWKDKRGREKWGEKMRALVFGTARAERSYKVDLFMCAEENWGNTKLIRTGSAAFSKWFVTQKDKGGAMLPGYRQKDGFLWRQMAGDVWVEVPVLKEWDYFDLMRVPYVPPAFRDDNRWDRFLKTFYDFMTEHDGKISWRGEEE